MSDFTFLRDLALVMTAAAVLDWRPVEFSRGKIKKHKMPDLLPLAQNPDILKAVAPKKGKIIYHNASYCILPYTQIVVQIHQAYAGLLDGVPATES